jgi:thiamine transport system ATP-binding protein
MTLTVARLTVRYPDFTGVYDLSVPAGAIVAVIGPSGGGKTTLLHAIAGFEPVHGGSLTFDGQNLTPVPPGERPVFLLFQDNNLLPNLTAADNVGLALSPSLRLSRIQRDEVSAALASVDLAGADARFPGELSGGQRQRVALARALVARRPLLLLDEPFGALDPGLRRQMVALTARLARERGLTVLMTIHTPEDARAHADHVAFIADGHVADCGPAEAMLTPGRSAALDAFLGW